MPLFGESHNCSYSVACMFPNSAERGDRERATKSKICLSPWRIVSIASGPAPIVDLPVFSPHMNMSAQAAAWLRQPVGHRFERKTKGGGRRLCLASMTDHRYDRSTGSAD